jgi:polyribonucleotide nucleotidyltransferase
MKQALAQAKGGRIHILGEMNKVLATPRAEINGNAPTFVVIKINPDKIRDVIGKGGATIRAICEETKATIDINDDGTVRIYGETKEAADAAVKRVEQVTAEAEIGAIYEGKVAKIVDFGAFITILPGVDGLLHISQISDERVNAVTDFLSEGQAVKVKVLDVDNRGRIKLSMKEAKQA